MKNLIVILLTACLLTPLVAKERLKPKPMSELKNPDSPSYVPIPYPKTREELIQDIAYATKKLFMDKDGEYIVLGGKSTFHEIIFKLFGDKPVYRIGKIFVVNNRNRRAHNYTWLVLVENGAGRNIGLICMGAEGLFLSGCELLPEKEKMLLYTSNDVLNRVEEAIGTPFNKNNVKHCERMILDSSMIGMIEFPSWEIELHNGTVYYYNILKDEVYQVAKRIPLKFQSNGQYESILKYITPDVDNFGLDWIADQFIVLKRLGKIK